MTTATLTRRETFSRAPRVNFLHLLKAEWVGITTLRGTWISLAIGTALGIGLCLLVASGNAAFASSDMADEMTIDIPSVFTQSTYASQVLMIIAVLIGVNIFAREHATGSLRTYFAAAPRRGQTVGAKAVVSGLVVFVWSFVVFLLSILAVLPIYAANDWKTGFGDPFSHTLLPVLGCALLMALTTILSLGVATLIRSTAGAIVTVLAYLLLAPTILQLLPFDWAQDVVGVTFTMTGGSLYTVQEMTGHVVRDIVLTFAWPTVLLIAGIFVTRRRDV
ncbi:MAG: ABC transporter permease subunit [Microbacterium sp.]